LPNNQTGIANGTTINAGDSIGPFLAAAFRKSSPAVYTGPSLSLSANNAPSVVEVGTSISITFAIGYTANDAGAETSRTMHKNGAVFNATGGAYTDTIVASTSPISYYATVNYAQGGINNDSLGGPDASGRIPAGLIDSGTLNYQGFYKIWYDAVSAAPASSAAARALSNVRFTTDGNNFTLNTGSSQTKFVLLLPPGKSLASVIDQDALNLDITAQYTASTISVNNAAGVAISYTLYTMSQSIPYSSNHRHNITIA
jgi:hypothetical protein